MFGKLMENLVVLVWVAAKLAKIEQTLTALLGRSVINKEITEPKDKDKMVKRYDEISWQNGDVMEFDFGEVVGGDYVTYADYAELQAKADEMEAALREIFSASLCTGSRHTARIALAQHGSNTK